AVHGWFAQALVEAVIGIEALRNSKQWSAADIQTALSEEALTSCVMQRYHIHLAAKRELGSKIGSAKQAAAYLPARQNALDRHAEGTSYLSVLPETLLFASFR